MDLETKLNELSAYDIAFEIKQGYYHISVRFKDEWDVIVPENQYIYLEKRNGLYHYISNINDVKIDDIFNAVTLTINYNLDLEKKLILFTEKTKELQTLFAEKDIETLKTLEFKFKKKRTKRKSKKTTVKKNEKESKNTEKTNEENNEQNGEAIQENDAQEPKKAPETTENEKQEIKESEENQKLEQPDVKIE